MAIKTYTVGENSVVRRRDENTGLWIDISIPIVGVGMTCLDVMTNPQDVNHVAVVGTVSGLTGTYTGIVVSYDAGVTWNIPAGNWRTAKLYYEVWWESPLIIWAVSSEGYVAKSIDGGLSFTLTAARVAGGALTATTCIHAINDQIAVVGGCSAVLPGVNDVSVWKTTNGGTTWTQLNGGNDLINTLGVVTGFVNGIWISDDQQEIIVTTHYNQFRSVDAGATFTCIAPEVTRSGWHLTWYPSHVPNPNIFRHFGGPNYHIAESTNSGASWAITRSGQTITIQGAHFYDTDAGYYVVGNQTFETFNAGVNGTVTDNVPTINQLYAVWTGQFPVPPPCGCPEGYEYNPITGNCELTQTMDAIANGPTLDVKPGNKLTTYGSLGAVFYENIDGKPYPINSLGGMIRDYSGTILLSTPNITNDAWGDVQSPDTLNGRLNLSGIWANIALVGIQQNPQNEWIGYTECIDIPVNKIYQLGVAGDNRIRVTINGQVVIELGGCAPIPISSQTINYTTWHVFPITLVAGTNKIQIEGFNCQNFAAFAMEIYDATAAQLQAMTLPSEVDAVVVFSTINKIQGFFDLGQSSGYSCPTGWTLDICNGNLTCVRVLSQPFVVCNCYLITNCEDPQEQLTILLPPEDDPLDTDLIYVFDFDPDKCWTVAFSENCDFQQPYVTSVQSYVSCAACIGTCYQLTDCVTQAVIIVNDPTLAQYVGHAIQIDTISGIICMFVQSVLCPDVTVPLPGTIVDCFDNCQECIPVPPPTPELNIRNRTVKPGYDTPGCSPEYVDKVNCAFAEAIYQRMASVRFGLNFCCEPDERKWTIKKELLDLKMLEDPDACIAIPVECCPPCNVTATLTVYQVRTCDPPTNVTAQLIIS